MSSLRRLTVPAAAILSLSAAALVPASAAATPSTSVISTTLKTFDVHNRNTTFISPNMRAANGTATGFAGPVDLLCVSQVTGEVLATLRSNVPVSAGKWSATFGISALSNKACRLAAFPAGSSPTGDTAVAKIASAKSFAGPSARVGSVLWAYGSLGSPNSQFTFDAELSFPFPKALVTIRGAENGGLYTWQPIGVDGLRGKPVINGGSLGRDFNSGAGASGNIEANLVVDGAQAFTSYAMSASDPNATAANNEKITFSFDRQGNLTYTEAFPLFKCSQSPAKVVHADINSCPKLATTKLGVTWSHTLVMTSTGDLAKATDTFTSMDKKKHAIRFDQFVTADPAVTGARVGISGAFGSATPAAAKNAAGVGVAIDPAAPTSASNPKMQVVYQTKPASTWFTSGDGSRGVRATSRWVLAVAAGKSSSIKQGAALLLSDAEASAQIAAAGR